MRNAANLGFSVRLPADACWSCNKRDLTGRQWSAEDVHQLTLALLDGEYAKVTTVGEILAASASHHEGPYSESFGDPHGPR